MRPAHISLSLALFASALAAQSPIYRLDGDAANDFLGWSVSGVGDVDGDGSPDFIVGAPLADPNGSESGSARVFSGRKGSILYTLDGDSTLDQFGVSVGGAGDVDGDGYSDFVVGAWFDDNNASNSGSARVFSGKNGSILYTFDGDSVSDQLGNSVGGAGDVNGDGYADLIVGIWFDDNTGADSGSARVFSGKSGGVLYTFDGDSAGDAFGQSVKGAGDVNGDGYADLVVGANLDDNTGADSGSARIFSGVNGSVLYTFSGDSAGDQLGFSVSGAGDVNGDGYADLIVGAFADDNGGADAGSARVFSGVNGSVLYTIDGDSAGDLFGSSVSDSEDVDGDGKVDLIVGARLDGGATVPGSARACSGVDGSTLFTVDGTSLFERFGDSVSGVGDVNGDGYADFVVGARRADDNGNESGRAWLFSGIPLPLTTDTHLMSVGAASAQSLSLDAGVGNALASYWLFTNFAASGNGPGVTFAPGVILPLNSDVLTDLVISLTLLGGGGPTFVGWKGSLNASGQASASLNTFAAVPVGVGITLNHAALVYTADGCGVGCDTFQLATNWVPMTTVP